MQVVGSDHNCDFIALCSWASHFNFLSRFSHLQSRDNTSIFRAVISPNKASKLPMPGTWKLEKESFLSTASLCDPAYRRLVARSCVTPRHRSLTAWPCGITLSSRDPASPQLQCDPARALLDSIILFCQTFSTCGSIFWETWGNHDYNYIYVTTGSKNTAWILNELEYTF